MNIPLPSNPPPPPEKEPKTDGKFPYFRKSASGNTVYRIGGNQEFVTIRAVSVKGCSEYSYERTSLPESRNTDEEFPPGKFPAATQAEFKVMLQKYLDFSEQLKQRLNNL